MKHAASGVRGVFWRENPRGTQERRVTGGGRARGDWWIRWACPFGHLHASRSAPRVSPARKPNDAGSTSGARRGRRGRLPFSLAT
jgi:hypothetical protein